jgi:hypothetical protein
MLQVERFYKLNLMHKTRNTYSVSVLHYAFGIDQTIKNKSVNTRGKYVTPAIIFTGIVIVTYSPA